jgi:hypothetical protein
MRMRSMACVATIAAATVSVVGPGVAQAQLGLILGGGGTLPGSVSSALSYNGLGYNVLAGVALHMPLLPITLRFEGQYDQFSSPLNIYQSRIYSATVNAEYEIPTPIVRPYLVGGGGYYHITARYFNAAAAPGSPTEIETPTNGAGVNGGLGVRSGLGGMGLFAEWRYHYIFAGGARNNAGHTTYAPFTFGVMF